MPQFRIDGETEIFEAAQDIEVNGDICRYSFVAAELSDDNMVTLTPIELKDLPGFEGLLFQVDADEAEDIVILRQVQMFFWPWEDDEEFEGVDSPSSDHEIT